MSSYDRPKYKKKLSSTIIKSISIPKKYQKVTKVINYCLFYDIYECCFNT